MKQETSNEQTYFFGPYTGKTKPKESVLREKANEMRACGFEYGGSYGIHKAGKDRYFWFAHIMYSVMKHKSGGESSLLLDGLANTHDQAVSDAQSEILKHAPTGFIFEYRISDASYRYRQKYPSKANLKIDDDGRSAFPFWKDKFKVRLCDAYQRQYILPIVRVTDRFVYVLAVDALSDGLDLSKVKRSDCIAVNRVKFEMFGAVSKDFMYLTLDLEFERLGMDEFNPEPVEICPTERLDALRKQMQENHPDRGGEHERFVEIQAEYQMLKKRMAVGGQLI